MAIFAYNGPDFEPEPTEAIDDFLKACKGLIDLNQEDNDGEPND